MYHGPLVQAGVARRTTAGSALAAPFAWAHTAVAVATILAIIATVWALTYRTKKDWR